MRVCRTCYGTKHKYVITTSFGGMCLPLTCDDCGPNGAKEYVDIDYSWKPKNDWKTTKQTFTVVK